MTEYISLQTAILLLEKAQTEAKRLGLTMSFAVVDAAGHLLALHRMDGDRWISADIAHSKAYTAAAFRAPTERIADRGQNVPMFFNAISAMTHGRFTPQKGGIPIKNEQGKIIGAIGASGASGEEDVQVLERALE